MLLAFLMAFTESYSPGIDLWVENLCTLCESITCCLRPLCLCDIQYTFYQASVSPLFFGISVPTCSQIPLLRYGDYDWLG